MRKSTGMRNGWIATALVVLAALVLAGCPHNGFLERGGGSGGGSSRGGGGEVTLIITNFVDGGPVTNRSALSGSMRTIAPEHIDLTVDAEIAKYVFVAYATGNGTWGPQFIDIASGTGQAVLGLSGGTWEVTLEAYDVERLKANAGTVGATINGTNKEDIMRQDDPAEVQKVTDALVLTGGAMVDTGGGNQVTLTLTNDTVAGDGEVDIAVYFTNQNDVQSIFGGATNYEVSAALVNLVTQQVVMVGTEPSSQILYSRQPAVDTDPNGYDYQSYDPQTKTYSTNNVTTVPGNTKVLRYNPKSVAGQQALKIPHGKYMLLVTVTDTNTDTELYRSDSDFIVDANRITIGMFEINGILGVAPSKPGAFDVYWTKPTTKDQLEGFDAAFVWGESNLDAVGYTIEIADITSIYRLDGGNTQIQVVGGTYETFTSAQNLWEDFLDQTTKIADPSPYVTRLDWKITPQSLTNIPRWISGSLLIGNTSLSLRMETGHVYTARIRADNGTNSSSDWTYIGSGTTTLATATKFDVPATKGIFDLMQFSYILKATDMWTLVADRNADMRVNNGADTQVKDEDLLQVVEYNPGTKAELDYGFEGNTVEASQDDQVLTVEGQVDIVQSWQGWQDTRNGALFGPVSGPAAGPAWVKADWTYDGFNDLDLEPVGAGGSSIRLQTETAGTFNVLSLDTVGFGTATPTNTLNKSTLAGLVAFSPTSTRGVYKNAAGNRLVVVIERDRNQNPVTYQDIELYVSVGDKGTGVDQVTATLSDKNGTAIKVSNLQVQILENGHTVLKRTASFTSATADVPAYSVFNLANANGLMGMRPGNNYELKVQVTTGQGYTPTIQMPLTILYADQAATANIP